MSEIDLSKLTDKELLELSKKVKRETVARNKIVTKDAMLPYEKLYKTVYGEDPTGDHEKGHFVGEIKERILFLCDYILGNFAMKNKWCGASYDCVITRNKGVIDISLRDNYEKLVNELLDLIAKYYVPGTFEDIRSKTTFALERVYFPREYDAVEVLKTLRKDISIFGEATVYDFYKYSKGGNPAKEYKDYGWKILKHIEVEKNEDLNVFYIDLPTPTLLD